MFSLRLLNKYSKLQRKTFLSVYTECLLKLHLNIHFNIIILTIYLIQKIYVRILKIERNKKKSYKRHLKTMEETTTTTKKLIYFQVPKKKEN